MKKPTLKSQWGKHKQENIKETQTPTRNKHSIRIEGKRKRAGKEELDVGNICTQKYQTPINTTPTTNNNTTNKQYKPLSTMAKLANTPQLWQNRRKQTWKRKRCTKTPQQRTETRRQRKDEDDYIMYWDADPALSSCNCLSCTVTIFCLVSRPQLSEHNFLTCEQPQLSELRRTPSAPVGCRLHPAPFLFTFGMAFCTVLT